MIDLVPYGRPAREALAAAIAAAKSGDALAPVTVIVPTNYAGLGLRRALAAQTPLVNVRFQVAGRAAELLGGAALAAERRTPLVPWVRMEAVRAALREDAGIFAPVVAHPATAKQLARAFDDLRDATSETLHRLAALSPRTADVVRLLRRTKELTAAYYDESDLFRAAAGAVMSGAPGAREAGALILYLPRRLPDALARLLEAVAATVGAGAVIGLTGDGQVDALARQMAARLSGLGPVREGVEAAVPAGSMVASLPDPEEEVRHAVRKAVALAHQGVPLYRMAILFQRPEQYALLAHEVLDSAGIPHNGPPVRRLAQSLAGRAVLGAYRMAASGFRREVVMDWLTSAPIPGEDGAPAPSHRWDAISREAGVVRGVDHWTARLAGWADAREARSTATPEAAAYNRRQAGQARALAGFMSALAEELASPVQAPPAGHARKAIELLERYLPLATVEHPGDGLAEAEAAAWEEVQGLLSSIANLEGQLPAAFEVPISRGEFATALEDVLDAPSGRVGSLGDGMFVGPISAAAELEFDTVFVAGLVEGNSGGGEDPIITEQERDQAGDEVPSRRLGLLQQRRAYLAALAGADTRALSYPRADLRGQRTTTPSRWLLESATTQAGTALYASDLAEMLKSPPYPEWFEAVHSFQSVLSNDGERASLQERDLASLLGARSAPERHYLASRIDGLGDGMAARRSRARKRRTAGPGTAELDGWNGRVPGGSVAAAGTGEPVSPTALETFAQCPFRYFLGHVLKVGDIERPEEIETITAADAGNVMHGALEEFFNETHPRGDALAPWSAKERTRLREIAERHCAEAERRGLTGKPLAWAADRARILRDLELFLDADQKYRASTGFVFERAEVAFGASRDGSPPPPPARYTLPDGTGIAFRGYIDRVDSGPNGELMVTDYKTGRAEKFKVVGKPDPLVRLDGGKRLQLPVYALALENEGGGQPISARYWFITERENYEQAILPLDGPTREAFGDVVQVLANTMRQGYFPAVPGEEDGRNSSYTNCLYCPYDRICAPSQRLEIWKQWKGGPVVRDFAALSEGTLPGVEATDE